jgi:hypothetical protein
MELWLARGQASRECVCVLRESERERARACEREKARERVCERNLRMPPPRLCLQKYLSRCSLCLSLSPVCVRVCVRVCHISCREAADYALVVVGLTALSCDPNVLRLIAGESTPRECLLGMAADFKVNRSPLN